MNHNVPANLQHLLRGMSRPQEVVVQQQEMLSKKPEQPAMQRRDWLDDESLVLKAKSPGELIMLGFRYFEKWADWSDPFTVSATPSRVLTLSVSDKDGIMVILDWRNYAYRNVGGLLVPIRPGELSPVNVLFNIKLNNTPGLGSYQYTPTEGVAGQNAVGNLCTENNFAWPGRMMELMRYQQSLTVEMQKLALAVPPNAEPARVTTQIIGFYRRER